MIHHAMDSCDTDVPDAVDGMSEGLGDDGGFLGDGKIEVPAQTMTILPRTSGAGIGVLEEGRAHERADGEPRRAGQPG